MQEPEKTCYMDDNEYIRQLEQAAALPDWIARKKAYLRINLRRLDTMVQEQTSVVLASKTNVANTSLDGLKAAAEKLAVDAAEYEAVKSRRDSTARSIHILDSEDERRYREQNKDIDGTCQWNYSASGCGRPTVEGSRWCGRHVGLWSDNMAEHIIGEWRGLYVEHGPDGDFARSTHVLRVGVSELRATVDESRRELAQGYETDDLCPSAEIECWTTLPEDLT